MCGRFTQAYTWQEVHDFYQLTGPARNLQPNYNVAPTQTVNVLLAGEAGLELHDMRWGLVPDLVEEAAQMPGSVTGSVIGATKPGCLTAPPTAFARRPRRAWQRQAPVTSRSRA